METYTLEKTVVVSYAHVLPGHPTCGKLHGHNTRITFVMTVKGLRGPYKFVVDFGWLKEMADQYDHCGRTITTSSEVFAKYLGDQILYRLAHHSQEPLLVAVTIEETPSSKVTWTWRKEEEHAEC